MYRQRPIYVCMVDWCVWFVKDIPPRQQPGGDGGPLYYTLWSLWSKGGSSDPQTPLAVRACIIVNSSYIS